MISLCTRQESAGSFAQEVGVSRFRLYNWKNQLLGREVPAAVKHRRDLPTAPERETLERQVEELRREIRRLQLE